MNQKTSRLAAFTRKYRKFHKYIGLLLLGFVLISSVTGVLLAWKKEAAWLQPSTRKGESKELSNWLPIDQLASKAAAALQAQNPNLQSYQLDRIDVRPSKGIAKCLFEKGYWEVQIDGVSGDIKSIAKRNSDWIESIHDGSIISDVFKLISMNLLGFGLIVLGLTGLLLWLNPKCIRRIKKGIDSN